MEKDSSVEEQENTKEQTEKVNAIDSIFVRMFPNQKTQNVDPKNRPQYLIKSK